MTMPLPPAVDQGAGGGRAGHETSYVFARVFIEVVGLWLKTVQEHARQLLDGGLGCRLVEGNASVLD